MIPHDLEPLAVPLTCELCQTHSSQLHRLVVVSMHWLLCDWCQTAAERAANLNARGDLFELRALALAEGKPQAGVVAAVDRMLRSLA